MRLLKSELVQIYESHLKRNERTVLLEAYWGTRDMVDFHDDRYKELFTEDQLELGATVTVGGEPISSPPELLLEGGFKDDAENAILIHGWLKGLSRAEANDPRLWVTLTHGEFFHYVRKRWSITRETSANSILSRFFFSGSGIQARTRNAISRLWWLAELSHEPGVEEDPYGLLKLTMRLQDMQLNLYERSYAMVEPLRRLIPRFYSDADGNARFRNHSDFDYIYKGLTAWSASTPIAMLSDPKTCWELLCQIEDLHFRMDPSLEKRVGPRREFPADVFELSGIGQSVAGSTMIVEEGAELTLERTDEDGSTTAELAGEVIEEEVGTQEAEEDDVTIEELDVPRPPDAPTARGQVEQRSCVLFICELKPGVKERFDGAKFMVGWCFEEGWERTVGNQALPMRRRIDHLDDGWRDSVERITRGESPKLHIAFRDLGREARAMAVEKTTRFGRKTISFVEVMEGSEDEDEPRPGAVVIFLCSTRRTVKRREQVNLVIRQCSLSKWKALEGFYEVGYRGQVLLTELSDSRINDHLQRVMLDEGMRVVGAGEDAGERMEAWKVELASARRRAMLESEFRELMGLKADA